jgi:hypothetical protein
MHSKHGHICHCLDPFLQITVAQTTWPSAQTWALVAELYGIMFHNKTITYKESTEDIVNGALNPTYDLVKEIVSQNFLQVQII